MRNLSYSFSFSISCFVFSSLFIFRFSCLIRLFLPSQSLTLLFSVLWSLNFASLISFSLLFLSFLLFLIPHFLHLYLEFYLLYSQYLFSFSTSTQSLSFLSQCLFNCYTLLCIYLSTSTVYQLFSSCLSVYLPFYYLNIFFLSFFLFIFVKI